MSRQPNHPAAPTAWGTPGQSITDDADLIQAGARGEQAIAHILQTEIDRTDTFVFHDLDAGYKDTNFDHVVLRGDLLILIDSKTWAPGRYEWVNAGRNGACLRDGQPFKPGNLYAIDKQVKNLRGKTLWQCRVERIVAVAPSRGVDADLNFDDYDPPHVTVVKAGELGDYVNRLLDSADMTHKNHNMLYFLTQDVRQPEFVTGPYALGRLGPPGEHVNVPPPTSTHTVPRPPVLPILAIVMTFATWLPAYLQRANTPDLMRRAWWVSLAVACVSSAVFAIRVRRHGDTITEPLRWMQNVIRADQRLAKQQETPLGPFWLVPIPMIFMLMFTGASTAGFVWMYRSWEGADNPVTYWAGAAALTFTVGIAGWAYREMVLATRELVSLNEGHGWQREWNRLFVLIGDLEPSMLPIAGHALRSHPTLATEAYMNRAATGALGERWQRFAEAVQAGRPSPEAIEHP